MQGDVGYSTTCLRVSRRLNNGDWDYWIVLEVVNMGEACGDDFPHKYMVGLSAVSPEAAGPEKVARAIEDLNIGDDPDEMVKVEGLHEYGVCARLWSDSGNNARVLMQEARRQADFIELLFGFAMDKPQNRLGHNGWDLIKGDISWETAQQRLAEWEARDK